MKTKILIIFSIMFLLLPLISSFEFDNIRSYDEKTKTITIKNSLLYVIPLSTIAEIKLNTPHKNEVPMGYQMIAEITLNSKDVKYLNVLSKMELFDMRNDNKKFERQIDYKYLTTRTINYFVEEKVYDKENITFKYVNKEYSYEEEYWEDFDFKDVKKGIYTIGLFMQVNWRDKIEWIPTLYGVKIPEWAIVVQSSGTTTYQDIGGVNYTTETFTSNGYFNVTGGTLNVSVLVVAGGGAGGGSFQNIGGGGGAGGLIYNTENLSMSAGDYPIYVGVGGNGIVSNTRGVSGQNSSALGLYAFGGGGGGAGASGDNINGADGGSAGGAGWYGVGGNALQTNFSNATGFGRDGGDGAGGGGGGANNVGENGGGEGAGGDGGAGRTYDINGTSTCYAGGGGGGMANTIDWSIATCGGGRGGGGQTYGTNPSKGWDAIDGTGGGGGGSGYDGTSGTFAGGSGGDGIVIIRYFIFIDEPVVTLETPNNYTNFTTNEVDFECYVYDYVNALTNVSLYIDDVLNETVNNPSNATSEWFNKILSEGEHWWTCEVYSNISESFTADVFVLNVDTTPNIQFETPTYADYSNITQGFIPVNVSITETYFDNLTFNFWLDGANTDWNWNDDTRYQNESFADGTWEYNVTVWTTTGQSNTTATRNISIDTTYPNVSSSNITNIITTSLPINSTWGFNASDSNIHLCYYNSTANVTYNIVTCNSSITDLEWTLGGNKTIQFCANDTFGLETCNTEYIWVYSITETQADNPDPIGEGATATFTLTVNLTDIGVTTANFLINGSVYAPTTTTAGTDGYYFTKTLVIPDGWGNTTGYPMDWNWNYTITGVTTNETTDTENITIYELAVDDCSTYTQNILNLSLRDEEGNSVIDSDTYNTTVEVEIVMASIVDPSSTIEYSYTFINETNPQLCMPFNLLNNTNYTADITIGFDSDDHVWEFWHLDEGIISLAGDFNDYTDRNVNLMNLLTADSTSFLFNYFDVDGQAVDGSLVHVFRKFIGDGEFLEVERSQADENGDTIAHLVEEDVIYYFMITLDGVILYTSSTYTALCQAVPCTINLEEGGESAVFDTDYDLIEGGSYSITSSRTSRLVSLSYELEDPATMNFTLYRYESDGSYAQINTSEDTDTNGVLTLYVPQSAGNISFFASVKKDDQFINSEWIDFSGQAIDHFGVVLSIFFGGILILTLGLMAVSTGAGVLIWVMVGVFVSGAFGLFATTLSTGISVVIYLICAGGLLLWKLTGARK